MYPGDSTRRLGAQEVICIAAASLSIIDIVYNWFRDAKSKKPDSNITVYIDFRESMQMDGKDSTKPQDDER